jgi:Uma2 family endonuclease
MAISAVAYDDDSQQADPSVGVVYRDREPGSFHVMYTYNDYKDLPLPDGVRVELIDGVFYMMAAPNEGHQAISMALGSALYDFLKGKPCKVRAAPYDVRPFYREDGSDWTTVQPDLSVICNPGLLGMDGDHGGPTMVVEILSPSNTINEMARKLDVYMRAGVQEYWVVNPKTKTIQVYNLKDNPASLKQYGLEDTIESFSLPGFSIALKVIFAELLEMGR